MPKPQNAASNVVSFRPGPEMQEWLATVAKQWGLSSPAEAAKRAAILLVLGLDAAFYEPVMELVKAKNREHNPDGFAETAMDVYQILEGLREHGTNLTRAQMIEQIRNEVERITARLRTTKAMIEA